MGVTPCHTLIFDLKFPFYSSFRQERLCHFKRNFGREVFKIPHFVCSGPTIFYFLYFSLLVFYLSFSLLFVFTFVNYFISVFILFLLFLLFFYLSFFNQKSKKAATAVLLCLLSVPSKPCQKLFILVLLVGITLQFAVYSRFHWIQKCILYAYISEVTTRSRGGRKIFTSPNPRNQNFRITKSFTNT